MNDLHAGWFQELLAAHEPPCVSLYQPVNRLRPPGDDDRIRFRTQVEEARAALSKQFGNKVAESVVEKLRTWDNDDFWAGAPRDAVAFFVSGDHQTAIDLQQSVPEALIIGDSYHVKPLIRVLQNGDRYQLLCFSEKNIEMFEGSRYRLDRLELKHVPQNLYQVAGMRLGGAVDSSQDLLQAERQTSEGPGAIFAPGKVDQFMRAVDKAVWENYTRVSKLPLILVAIEEHHPTFQGVSKNPYLVKEGIKLNPLHLPIERLREEAWKIMEPAFQANLERLTNDFRAAKAHQKGSDEVTEVAEAAASGRVGTLLVQDGQRIPGQVARDDYTGAIQPPAARADKRHAEDVLDDLAETVLRMDGQVLVLPPESMPTDTGVAAIYRY